MNLRWIDRVVFGVAIVLLIPLLVHVGEIFWRFIQDVRTFGW